MRFVARQHSVSARSLDRHGANHPQLPAVPAQSVRDNTGNIVNGTGGAVAAGSKPTSTGGPLLHPVRWWHPAPSPQRGVSC